MRKLAVRTNWPTVALKPERKALKGCCGTGGVSIESTDSIQFNPHSIPVLLKEIFL